MRQTPKVEGTKIAQAAKDLNVTSVTIRRYLTEFNIETTADDNGIKVLPNIALEELKEVRRLKEEGLTNPRVLEILEEYRAKNNNGANKPSQALATSSASASRSKDAEDEEIKKKSNKTPDNQSDEESLAEEDIPEEIEAGDTATASDETEGNVDTRPKHSLTCQTCGKVFEHMNPRLRDCLDCYRTKRKERRRGGSERHKNVIQHPLAQQATNKIPQNGGAAATAATASGGAVVINEQEPIAAPMQTTPPMAFIQRGGPVRNYRKAIEETRQITGSLKRRLERPDLPEGERRWLEQIYAYQLILHQGWRHLSDYTNAGQQQNKTLED
jgi:DNA-binding transcriptional MerR regulator